MLNYIQGLLVTALEMICCKMFFETFSEKRTENSCRNRGIIFGLIISVYSIAIVFYSQFVLKQGLVIISIAIFMVLYLKIYVWKAFIFSLLFQGLLLSAVILHFGSMFHFFIA